MSKERVPEKKVTGSGIKATVARIGISGVVLVGGVGGLGCAREVIKEVPGPERIVAKEVLVTPTPEPKIPVAPKGIDQEAIKKAVRDVLKEQQTPIPTEKPLTREDLQRIADEAAEKAVRRAPTPMPQQPTMAPNPYLPQSPYYQIPRPFEVSPGPGFEVYVPKVFESTIYGDFFAVRFNSSTGFYDLIDTRINQRVDPARFMVPPISNLLTGVGNTLPISYFLNPGQAAVEQGYFVNGEGPGTFQMRFNRSVGNTNPVSYSPTLSDGSVTIVPIANVTAHYVDALNRAIVNNWARSNVRGER